MEQSKVIYSNSVPSKFLVSSKLVFIPTNSKNFVSSNTVEYSIPYLYYGPTFFISSYITTDEVEATLASKQGQTVKLTENPVIQKKIQKKIK